MLFLSLAATRARMNDIGVMPQHTTAYHLQANGMVARFHQTFKVALRARLPNIDLINQLSWVLLSLCTMPKADFNASSAELVYGLTLTLPSTTLGQQDKAIFDPAGLLHRLRQLDPSLTPTPIFTHGLQDFSMPRSLLEATLVFI